MFTPAPLQIVLNIYDIHQSNSVLYSVGAGFYHTGVEVNGYEYSFSPSGVLRTRPRLPEFGTLREQLTMGIPSWVNRMAGVGALATSKPSSANKWGDKLAAPGVVKAPDMLQSGNSKPPVQATTNKPATTEEASISQSIFSWFGWGSTDSSTASNASTAQETTPTGTATSSSKKKELTDKQKELLAKIKS
eukprot:gene18387-20932_t